MQPPPPKRQKIGNGQKKERSPSTTTTHGLDSSVDDGEDDRNPATRIKLNIGGHHFETTLGTLTTKSGWFRTMFDFPNRLDDGEYFLDRDGTHFQVILNFLRNVNFVCPTDPVMREEIIGEAQFYQLPDLVDILQYEPCWRIKPDFFVRDTDPARTSRSSQVAHPWLHYSRYSVTQRLEHQSIRSVEAFRGGVHCFGVRVTPTGSSDMGKWYAYYCAIRLDANGMERGPGLASDSHTLNPMPWCRGVEIKQPYLLHPVGEVYLEVMVDVDRRKLCIQNPDAQLRFDLNIEQWEPPYYPRVEAFPPRHNRNRITNPAPKEFELKVEIVHVPRAAFKRDMTMLSATKPPVRR